MFDQTKEQGYVFVYSCSEEALATVNEAVRAAQESNDEMCLHHAMVSCLHQHVHVHVLVYDCAFLVSPILLAQIWLERLGVESASHSWYHVDRAATTNREGETPHLGAQTIINIAKNRAFTNTHPKSKEECDHM